ncbi:MAG: 4-hydroxybenzoate octaprenyltransferase [Sphingomonadales bacterium]|jgi:4-hydroxybenzoate polyprenyltransferase
MTDPVKPADSSNRNWVDIMPSSLRPYLRLARADRPIGTWLLLWPCWWSLALAGLKPGEMGISLFYMLLFAIGAFVMRGAGCAYNDIVDADFDVQVERTKGRPIPAGQLSKKQAWAFTIALALVGLLVLLQFNNFTIVLGLGAIPVVALYPFAKRFTNWPQAVLGLAFNWGALMGWAAVHQNVGIPALLLYVAGLFWTLGYDTIYAHQDKEDDALIGVKSTALHFGAKTKTWLNVFYLSATLLLTTSAILAGGGLWAAALVLAACAHLGWQISRLDIDDPENCLALFRSNHIFGLMLFLAIAIPGFLN